jgi:integrase-like protein
MRLAYGLGPQLLPLELAPLLRVEPAGRDDSDRRFIAYLNVDDKENPRKDRVAHDGHASLGMCRAAILAHSGERICEHGCCLLEGYAVLSQIRLRLRAAPDEGEPVDLHRVVTCFHPRKLYRGLGPSGATLRRARDGDLQEQLRPIREGSSGNPTTSLAWPKARKRILRLQRPIRLREPRALVRILGIPSASEESRGHAQQDSNLRKSPRSRCASPSRHKSSRSRCSPWRVFAGRTKGAQVNSSIISHVRQDSNLRPAALEGHAGWVRESADWATFRKIAPFRVRKSAATVRMATIAPSASACPHQHRRGDPGARRGRCRDGAPAAQVTANRVATPPAGASDARSTPPKISDTNDENQSAGGGKKRKGITGGAVLDVGKLGGKANADNGRGTAAVALMSTIGKRLIRGPRVGRHPQPTDFVFPNASGEGWRPATAKMLRADLRAAGLPAAFQGHPYTAHATRRSFSTWLREAGVDAETRDRLMGHAPASVGERHYTAMTAAVLAKLRDAVELIELDLSSGELIALPMRAVGEVDPAPQAVGLTADFTAGLTAGRSKRHHKSSMISKARHAGVEPATYGSGGRRSIQLS